MLRVCCVYVCVVVHLLQHFGFLIDLHANILFCVCICTYIYVGMSSSQSSSYLLLPQSSSNTSLLPRHVSCVSMVPCPTRRSHTRISIGSMHKGKVLCRHSDDVCACVCVYADYCTLLICVYKHCCLNING